MKLAKEGHEAKGDEESNESQGGSIAADAARSDWMIGEPERVADADILNRAMAILEKELAKRPDKWRGRASGYMGYLTVQTLSIVTEVDGFSEADKIRVQQIVTETKPELSESEGPRTPSTAKDAMRSTTKEWELWQRLPQR